jgi:predicted nicotinamide N-methyase
MVLVRLAETEPMTGLDTQSLESTSTLVPLRVRVEQDSNSKQQHSHEARDVVLEFECDWDVGIGGSVWTSGEILTSHLASQQLKYRSIFKDKVVVELGSGTGYVGLMTAVCFEPAKVFITDLTTHVDCMQKNVTRNASKFNPGVDVRVLELAWGEVQHEDALLQAIGADRHVDIILGTDVAYLRELYEPLLHTLRHLSNDSTLVLLGMNRIDTGMVFFQRLAQEGFEYYKIADQYLPREYAGKDFGLFEIQRRRAFTTIMRK